MPERKASKGLTLIEVLIIVVMVAILMTIVFQKIRSRTAKDLFAPLRTDVESVRTAESKYFATHNAYGNRAQLDSASLLTPPPASNVAIAATATGYSVIARNDADTATPATCTLQVDGGEAAASAAKTVCRE
jgi:Tfp pilus assembly protein PilE